MKNHTHKLALAATLTPLALTLTACADSTPNGAEEPTPPPAAAEPPATDTITETEQIAMEACGQARTTNPHPQDTNWTEHFNVYEPDANINYTADWTEDDHGITHWECTFTWDGTNPPTNITVTQL